MPPVSRVASSVLFALGVALVLLGLSAALGFSIAGAVASAAAVAALLYAGGVWFGERTAAAAPSVLAFDRELRITGGPYAGAPVASRFPATLREEIQRRCEAAAAGQYSHFICTDNARERVFDAAPVLGAASSGICGVLVEGASAMLAPLPTDAAVGVV